MLLYAIKSAFVLTLLYVPYYFLLSKDSFFHFNRMVLLSILLLSLTLPLCNISPLSFDENPVVHEAQTQMVSIGIPIEQYEYPKAPEHVDNVNVNTERVEVSEHDEQGLSWFSFVGLIYVVGMAGVLFVRLWQHVRMRIAIRKGCLWMKKEGKYRIFCRQEDISPCSWMNDIILSQYDYMNNPDEIILHEKGHAVNHHSLDIIVLTVVQMVQWWNPVAYVIGLSLRDVHEYEADDYALSAGVIAKKYQTLLILKAAGSSSYALANNFNESLTKKRITMMIKRKSSPWMQGKALLLVPMVFIALGAFATPDFIAPIEDIVTEISEKSFIMENDRFNLSGVSVIQDEEAKEKVESKSQPNATELKKLADGEILILLDGKVVTIEELKAMENKPYIVDSYVDELAWQIYSSEDGFNSTGIESTLGFYYNDYKENGAKYGQYGASDKNGVLCLYSANAYEASKLMLMGDSLGAMQALDKFLAGKSDNATKAKCILYVAEVAFKNHYYSLATDLCKKAQTYNENYGRPLTLIARILYQTAPRAAWSLLKALNRPMDVEEAKKVTATQLFWYFGLWCCWATDKAEEAARIDPSCERYSAQIKSRCSVHYFPKSQIEKNEEYKNYKEGDEIVVNGEKITLRLK